MKLNEQLPWKTYPVTERPTVVTVIAMHACTHMLTDSPYLTSQLQL